MQASILRKVAREILADRGFDVQIKSGQGYLPGSRLTIVREQNQRDVAVKASRDRTISFTRLSSGRWRTLHQVDLVVAVAPATTGDDHVDVFAFERKKLVNVFNSAWKALELAERPIGLNTPIFVPLDKISHKNVGHDIGNLKRRAEWSVHLDKEHLALLVSRKSESYLDEFRRRFAADNGVDINQVLISITGKSH